MTRPQDACWPSAVPVPSIPSYFCQYSKSFRASALVLDCFWSFSVSDEVCGT